MRGHGSSLADGLIEWARASTRMRDVLTALPAFDGADHAGLFADASRAPWSSAGAELRVSVLRVMSVPHEGAAPVLVGQLHATETMHPTTRLRRLRFVVHAYAGASAREVDDADAWWLTVLDRHYALGGLPVDAAGVSVPA